MGSEKTTPVEGICGLCRTWSILRDSHFLARAIYRLVRSYGSRNENPVLVTQQLSKHTSHQVSQYLLCPECEDRFNKHGEHWVLETCFRGNGKFRLHSALMNTSPLWSKGDLRVYPGRSIQGIQIDKLIYFAASVYWRASVCSWEIDGHSVRPISLGRDYEDEFRLFLLGLSDFPRNAVIWVLVSLSATPLLAFDFPLGGQQGTCHHYRFRVPGITFHLYLGKRIPEIVRKMCTLRSPQKLIYMTQKVEDDLVSDLSGMVSRTRSSKSLEVSVKELESSFRLRDAPVPFKKSGN